MDYPPIRIIAAMRADVFPKVLISDTLWMCVACSMCSTSCPAQIPLTSDLMSRLKEEFILRGIVPEELQTALENSQRYGNPLGEASRKRANWIRGAGVPVPIFGKDVTQAQVLWFVGDYASYHLRAQRASQALARLLHLLKVDFAILGNEETSDGDSQRLAGERGLFELLVEKNSKAFKKYKFKEIITTDPHAYNALKNQYPLFGVSYPLKHSTQFLYERIDQLNPLLRREVHARVAYHDPCYLGRVNEVYEAPRALLKAIPGITLVELHHHHKTSLCCGGGGGGMWLDGFQWEKSHTRLSEWCVQEALSVKAGVLAIACPYETPRFEDAIKTVSRTNGLAIKDVCELLLESVGPES
jgi:Fe-S oxidoreductase